MSSPELNSPSPRARGKWSFGTLAAGVLFGLLLLAALLVGARGKRLPVTETRGPVSTAAAAESMAESGSGTVDRSRRTAIVEAAQRVGPSVVTLSVVQTRVVQTSPVPLGNEFFEPFFRDMI